MVGGLTTWLVSATAAAAPPPDAPPVTASQTTVAAIIHPTAVVSGGEGGAADPGAIGLARKLDQELREVSEDLGLSLPPADSEAKAAAIPPSELAGAARRSGVLLVIPSLRRRGDTFELELTVGQSDSPVLLRRVETAEADELSVRAVVMLRDLVREHRAARASRSGVDAPGVAPEPGDLATPARSEGRLTLAVNATLYGGLVGYSIQRASGSDDPRLLYPLMAVGAGVGLGGSMIVAGEWDVGVGDAWFLAGGAWWPTLSGILIYEGRFADLKTPEEADESRWTYGLIGGTTGLTLSTLALSLGKMDSGGALLSHSGGALGTVYGGLAEMAIEGDIDFVPEAGMGYGAAFGWLAASAVAVHIRPPPSRVLALDLGSALGGLAGSALASPLLFDEPTQNQQRAWLGATAGGAVVGGLVALWWTAPSATQSASPAGLGFARRSDRPSVGIVSARPTIGPVGRSPDGEGGRPAYGPTLTGVWW